MRVTMMLADHAAASPDGKLYLNGAGWTVIGGPSPFGIGLYFEVPWDLANEPHEFTLELLDADGNSLEIQTSLDGDTEPLAYTGEFETGRPPGMKAGTPVPFVHAVNFPPLPLEPGSRYEWRLTVDGEQADDWRRAFTTAPGFSDPE
jgi:hypothetical protein